MTPRPGRSKPDIYPCPLRGAGAVDFFTLQSEYHRSINKHSPGRSMLELFINYYFIINKNPSPLNSIVNLLDSFFNILDNQTIIIAEGINQ